MSIIDRVIAEAGNQKALADLLGVSRSFVNQIAQGERPFPPERCPRIESELGIACEDLRPDVLWVRDASGKVTGYQIAIPPAANDSGEEAA